MVAERVIAPASLSDKETIDFGRIGRIGAGKLQRLAKNS